MNKEPLFKTWVVLCAVLILFLFLAGGVTAQTGNLFVATIAEVESQAFPQVTTFLTVFDQNGPVDKLDAANIQLFEDGQQIPASSITVKPQTLNNLRLVLVIDVSTFNSNNFDQVKTAAIAFINSIKPPEDRVALMSFATNVNLEIEFTNNTEDLQNFINNLTREETLTASHKALAEAVALFEPQTTGRKAVIVITDTPDNTGRSSNINETINRARALGVPLYMIGFGNRVRSDSLIEQLPLTGGQYFALGGVDQVQPALQDLLTMLRQGYRVSYVSDLKADDDQHSLSLIVSYQGREVQAETSFVAQSNDLIVKLPNLTPGTSIANKVNLTAQVITPAPKVTVEYLLNENRLGESNNPPYQITWDSSKLESGPYTLTARARDSVGNTGQLQIALNVAQPINVTLPATQNEVEVGEAVRFTPLVDIDAGADLVKVELQIDDKVQASLDAPPYTFPLDTSNFTVGPHTFTIRVEDNLGQVAETQRSIQFLPIEAAWAKWIRTLLGMDRATFEWWLEAAKQTLIGSIGLIAVLVTVLIGFVLLRLVKKAHLKAARRIRQLQIINLGNIQTPYHLKIEGAPETAQLRFALAGADLPQIAIAQPIEMMPQPHSMPYAPSVSTPRVSSPTSPGPKPASTPKEDHQIAKQSASRAKSAAAGAQGCLGTITGIFTTLAQLLPGSAGRSVRSAGQRISAGQGAVRRTTYAPKRMAKAAKTLKGQVGRAAPIPSQGAKSLAGPRDVETEVVDVEPVMAAQPQVMTPPMPGRAAHMMPSNGEEAATDYWAETPLISPGEYLNVDLVIAPANPYGKQNYAFTINSKAAEQNDEDWVSEEGAVQIKGISWLRRLASIVAVTLLVLIVTVGIVYLTWWRLTGVDILNWLVFV